jgi:hypothetical protein
LVDESMLVRVDVAMVKGLSRGCALVVNHLFGCGFWRRNATWQGPSSDHASCTALCVPCHVAPTHLHLVIRALGMTHACWWMDTHALRYRLCIGARACVLAGTHADLPSSNELAPELTARECTSHLLHTVIVIRHIYGGCTVVVQHSVVTRLAHDHENCFARTIDVKNNFLPPLDPACVFSPSARRNAALYSG